MLERIADTPLDNQPAGRPGRGTVLQPTAPAAPPPPPLGGDLSATAPGPPLTQVAAPQPGRVFQPKGPFPHVPQQVRAGATPRHGSAGAGVERGDHRGGWGREKREGTGRSTPKRHRHHARAGPRWRRDLDGGGGGHGRAFSPGAQRHPGHSSPHTLSLLRLPRTSREQQQSPPSTPLPREAEAKAEAAASSALSCLDHAPPGPSREMTPTRDRSRRASPLPSPQERSSRPL